MYLRAFLITKALVVFVVLCLVNKCLSSTKIYSIESHKVCSPIKKPHIHLNDLNPPAAVVTELRYFDTWLGDRDFRCKFKVESNTRPLSSNPFSNHDTEVGVFAVIQNFTLRQHDDGRCIDYIRFKQDSDIQSRPICGKMLELMLTPGWSPDPMTPFAPNAYLDPSGKLEVEIYVANQKLKPDERIDFTIAFTTYSGCISRSSVLKTCLNEEDDADRRYRFRYCISSQLFHDGIVNCPFLGCIDEGGCAVYDTGNMVDYGNGTAVTVSALAVIILVFVCFLSLLWLLRKLHVVCWAAPRTAGRPQPPPPTVHFTGDRVLDVMPSAPFSAPAGQPDTPDKDPPPAYDLLFPPKPSESRSTTT